MELPVKFPSETEEILEDAARYRSLTPEERMRSFRSFLNAGVSISRRAINGGWAKQFAEEQELLAQTNIREFFTRHGY
jgi:hypothetical protein